jgi:hypothetical protein
MHVPHDRVAGGVLALRENCGWCVRHPRREQRMSTIFDLPCPGCGEQMATTAEGDVECVACERRYHAGMGHLFPLVEPA